MKSSSRWRSFFCIIDLKSHSDYVIFESSMITQEARSVFRTIFEDFRRSHPFNSALFSKESNEAIKQ